jgi:hypothetical protein
VKPTTRQRSGLVTKPLRLGGDLPGTFLEALRFVAQSVRFHAQPINFCTQAVDLGSKPLIHHTPPVEYTRSRASTKAST